MEPVCLVGYSYCNVGGTTDHVAMALRMNGALYVVESAGSNFTHGKQG